MEPPASLARRWGNGLKRRGGGSRYAVPGCGGCGAARKVGERLVRSCKRFAAILNSGRVAKRPRKKKTRQGTPKGYPNLVFSLKIEV